jgi:hypothetical protein
MTDKATFDTLRQLFLTQNVSFPASGPRTGLYVFASGRNTLTDCANQERWWVTGEPAEMARLHRTYRETRETPGKPIAIHFSGTFARAPRSIDSNDSVSGDINLTNFTPVMVEYAASCPR